MWENKKDGVLLLIAGIVCSLVAFWSLQEPQHNFSLLVSAVVVIGVTIRYARKLIKAKKPNNTVDKT